MGPKQRVKAAGISCRRARTPEKDDKLRRSSRRCRSRWVNYLSPEVKRGRFTAEEDKIIIDAYEEHGNKWSKIAKLLEGRSNKAIANRWRYLLNRKYAEMVETGSTRDKSNQARNRARKQASPSKSSDDSVNSPAPRSILPRSRIASAKPEPKMVVVAVDNAASTEPTLCPPGDQPRKSPRPLGPASHQEAKEKQKRLSCGTSKGETTTFGSEKTESCPKMAVLTSRVPRKPRSIRVPIED